MYYDEFMMDKDAIIEQIKRDLVKYNQKDTGYDVKIADCIDIINHAYPMIIDDIKKNSNSELTVFRLFSINVHKYVTCYLSDADMELLASYYRIYNHKHHALIWISMLLILTSLLISFILLLKSEFASVIVVVFGIFFWVYSFPIMYKLIHWFDLFLIKKI